MKDNTIQSIKGFKDILPKWHTGEKGDKALKEIVIKIKKDTHFYGRGSPDPLRKDPTLKNFCKLHHRYMLRIL